MRSSRLLLPLLAALFAAACSEGDPTALTSPLFSPAAAHARCALPISDADADAAIDALLAEVDALEASGVLSSGQASALRNHLENARSQLEAGRYCAARAQLGAFREQVANFVADGVLSEEEAAPLLEGLDGVVTFNVALGKPVTLTGTYGFLMTGDPWTPTSLPPAAGSTITDGLFLPEANDWHRNTVWWDGWQPVSAGNVIEIDLQGAFVVTRFVAQADNNDNYPIQFQNPEGDWNAAWTVPAVPGYGMVTRERTLVVPIVVTALRFTGSGGDGYFSGSEVQAWGYAVP